MNVGKSNNIHLLILYFIILYSLLFSQESYAQTSMPDYDKLTPITTIVNSPTDVTLDTAENVYVVESVNNRLLKFSQSGQYLRTLIGLEKPISVAVDNNGIIYIGNKKEIYAGQGYVAVYDANFNLLRNLGIGIGEFGQPTSIDIDNNGNIYVVDYSQNSVKVYSSDGSYNHCFGCSANGSGQFATPKSIVIDKTTQEVLILDQPFLPLPPPASGSAKVGRIQTFQVNGSSWTLQRSFSSYGDLEGQMNKPQGVEIDEAGRIYVTESAYYAIYIYHSDCNVNGITNYCGKITDVQITTPMGIVRGNGNRLFVANLGSPGKVLIYGIVPYTNMQISPHSLNFQGQQYGNNPASKNVEITNNGTKILDWTASANESWITLSDTSGSLDISGVFTLGIGINMVGLSPNNYTGIVNVRSASGAAEEITVTLNVYSNPPVANPGGVYSATEGQSILLNASNSNGGLVRYQWDINYDGISDSYEYDATSPTQSHVYASQGTYTIKLHVTDQGNYTDDAITSAEISDSIPSSDFEGYPVNGPGPLTVNFINTSTGYDQPLSFQWDFDDDGIVDSTVQNPTHSYDNSGIYSVTLTVMDSDGSINSLNKPYYVTVSSETCPNLPVRIAGAVTEYFNTLQEAYNAAEQGDTIQIRTLTLSEYPDLNLNKTVTLEGGYDCDYLSGTDFTTINGTMSISDGTVIIGNIILN
jgi:PKD repeat protein